MMPPSSKTSILSYENDDLSLIPSFEKKGYRTNLILFVNGERIPDSKASLAQPDQTLLSFLRDVLRLTGSKLGCAEGGCGACTVMISRWDNQENKILHYSVNACLMPVCAADGCHVTTIEGVGSTREGLHPIQEQMVKYHGSQCGFCTPGIIVALYSLFASQKEKLPSTSYIEEHLDGNLCRCTGYRPIWDAAKSLCCDETKSCKKSCKSCPTSKDATISKEDKKEDCREKSIVEEDKKENHRDPSCSDKPKEEMCFSSTSEKCSHPLENLQFLQQPDSMFPTSVLQETLPPLLLVGNNCTWFKPTTVDQLLDLLQSFDNLKIVVGNTEVGIDTKFRHITFPRYVYPLSIPSLTSFDVFPTQIQIGACTPLSTILHQSSSVEDPICNAMRDMLRWFASTQIRNVASLGGNIVNASPIADMNPILMALDANVEIVSGKGTRRMQPVCDFFVSYRKVSIEPNEAIVKVVIPRLESELEFIFPFKQARRREDDISIVTSGMRIRLSASDGGYVINYAKFAFGGMGPTPLLAPQTARFLIGKEWNDETIKSARAVLAKDLVLEDNVPGGQVEYRRALCASFLHKFYLLVTAELNKQNSSSSSSISERDQSGALSFLSQPKPSISGTQTHPQPTYQPGLESPMSKNSTVSGQPVPHSSAALHCTGEAIYVDDIPQPHNMLHAVFILAEKTHCILTEMDTSPALQMKGVMGVFTARDLSHNTFGPIVQDEELFASREIKFVGMPLGVVVATHLDIAQKAARAVKISYRDLPGTPVITIEDAIVQKSFYEFARHKLECGDLDRDFTNPKAVVVEGEFRVGGQDHFYLECHTTLAIPNEFGLEIFASTQAPTKTQNACAKVTNIPANQVKVRTKRMGGGFGGKETRSWFISAAAAFASRKLNHPVRLTLDRNVDMSTTGGRHSFLAKYKASAIPIENGARLGGMELRLFSNAGCGFDLSGPVMDRALFHIDNVYKWNSIRAEGVPCKTNQPPHTAFRGFGGPQGLAICEHIMEELAQALKMDVEDLRRTNLYREGDATHFGMEIETDTWNIPRAWDELKSEAEFEIRKREVERFNQHNKYKKRGIVMLPTKFGIAFTTKFMNQGGALVHLYMDGTVLISHGGTEMGQGLHTKVCQIAAQAFNIPFSSVFIDETATDKVANTLPTAASMSTDLYGMATLDACQQILKRIEPIRQKLGPEATLAQIATAAHFERIDLSAHGFYALDGSRCGYDWDAPPRPGVVPENSHRGRPFNYFTQGVAVSEVEIDVLTGDSRAIRSDVKIDVGSSINPSIDLGQIEGAFIQGMGWSTIEEVIWADTDHEWVLPKGKLFTSGPGTYKIPAFNDVPETFNVSLLRGVPNRFAVASSKAIGEPPFFLGTSVYFAIKDAVRAARREFLGEGYDSFELRMPATSERVRMMCCDEIAGEGLAPEKGDEENRKRKVVEFQPKGSY